MPTTTPSSGQRITMLTAQASALATLDSSWIRKKSSARPVRNAISAATTTAARLINTALILSPRTSRTTPTTTLNTIAAAAPQPIDEPDTNQPTTNATGGRLASRAPLRPPSRLASDSRRATGGRGFSDGVSFTLSTLPDPPWPPAPAGRR
ncbi:hypothetical protein BJF85_13980 [Saccharomonospora sp. CUA-673]|nr:hypothetical protein BJF85_13980 [Saccharomonospora sp. CUA-673]